MNIQDAAKIVHQANKAYCESLGDFSQVDWEEASDEIKASAINGVKYKLENPNVMPVDSHNNWLRFKEEQGWKYGEEKDETLKTHPCFIPYDQLPLEQQIKDYLFTGIIHSIGQFIN